MSPELEAHLRMMATLPVRTHRQQEDVPSRPNGNFAFPESEREEIRKQMKVMRKSGLPLKAIGQAFGVAPATVMRYLK